MTFFERTSEEIAADALEKLSSNSNITQFSPGAKARLILDIVAEEQGNLHRTFDSNLMQAFIKYADDRFLDFFGDMLNLPRREATHAYADDENFMFYVSSGTFGDINAGSDITIPAGTTVSTVPYDGNLITPGLETQASIQYVTTSSAIASSSRSSVYVSIRASIEGSYSVVPKNVLQQHNLTNYTLSANNSLRCTNRYSISNGEDRESTESYRFRLQNVFQARKLAIPAAVRLAILSVPGVSDIKEVICEQGPGTYAIFVKALTPTTSPRLIRECTTAAYSVTGYGIRPFVSAAESLGLEFVCSVNWSTSATQGNITQGYIAMRNALEDRLNNTDIGEEIEFGELRDLLVAASRYAISIGENVPNKFEEIYLYRSDPSTSGTTRNLLKGEKVTPLYNERVILQTSGRHRGIRFITKQ